MTKEVAAKNWVSSIYSWTDGSHRSYPPGFFPQPGYSGSGIFADGGIVTITGPGGFGVKPVDPRPLLWMPVDSTNQLNPSPLGRSSATYGNSSAHNGLISYVATGGPTGGGWAQGYPVQASDTGTQKTWSNAVDVDQWGTTNPSPAINDYGAKYRLIRQVYKNWGHYTGYTGTGTDNYNYKNFRCWARNPDVVGSTGEVQPDLVLGVHNLRLVSEGTTYTPQPDFVRAGQGSGTPDQNAIDNGTAFDGGVPGTPNAVTFDNWYSEQFVLQANQSDPGATPPTPDYTSVIWNWEVEGLNGNQPAWPTPVQTYQWNEWYTKGSTVPSGRIMRMYFWHMDIEGNSGRLMIPVGSYVGYGPTYFDDSWCLVEARDNSVRASFTKTEVQIPSAWSDTSITITLRRGRFSSGSRTPIIVTDNGGTEHYVGDIVWP